MSRFDDATLAAYVDGELDAAERAAVEAALAAGDAALAQRLAAQRRLREQLRSAFDPVLDEPLPARLLAAARVPAANDPALAPPAAAPRPPVRRERVHWRWPEWGALAASLLIGLVAGSLLLRPQAPIGGDAGRLVARGALDRALTTQPSAAAPADAAARAGLSFVAADGRYCRSFGLRDEGVAGLACRHDGDWRIELLARADDGASASASYRTAGVALPDSVLRAIDARIDGPALDAAAERAAIAAGWRR